MVGNDIQNLELMKWMLRSPFEVNVVTQFDIQVNEGRAITTINTVYCRS